MISQIYRSLLTIGLISFFSFVVIFSAVEESWAATSFSQLTSSTHPQIAAMNGIKAVTKDIEGKAQEALGNITDNPEHQAAGKAKQAEADIRNAAEDVKSKAKDAADAVKDKARDVKNAID